MTNLLIGYPDVAFRATSILMSTTTEDASYPVSNGSAGSRADVVKIGTSAADFYVQFDLGASVASVAQYCFIAGANLLKNYGATTVELFAHNGGGVTSLLKVTHLNDTTVLTGPRAEDLLIVDGFNDENGGAVSTTPFRYHCLRIAGPSAALYQWRKHFFGNWFDFGKEPTFDLPRERTVTRSMRAAPYELTLTWEGVSDALKESFSDLIMKNTDTNPVFLYDAGDLILGGMKTIYGFFDDLKSEPLYTNSNRISVTFREAV